MPTIEGKELKLWYNEPAPDDDQGSTKGKGSYTDVKNGYIGWEHYALPLGNGYMGAMVFGQTEHERIQLTHNALSSSDPNDSDIGVGNFAEVYLDFPHQLSDTYDYYRELDLNTATAKVRYCYNGVKYEREYFTSYPDKVMVIRLSSARSGKVSFTLRPTIPYMGTGYTSSIERTGKVVADGDTIIMSGRYGIYNVLYQGIFKVVPHGGKLVAENENGDNGKITVTDADSVEVYISIGTNYPIGDSKVFTKDGAFKLFRSRLDEKELLSNVNNAAAKGFDAVYASHVSDFYGIFGRVRLDLASSSVPSLPTDALIRKYRTSGSNKTDGGTYLEELFFQYGRYLLISSSRKGGLPANLQGIWNRYYSSVCGSGYWHNINTQMNYWPAFSTNMAETFEPYVDYFNAIYPKLLRDSSLVISENAPENYDPKGDNGWNLGTGLRAYHAYCISGNGIDGYGTGALMAESFWDYYQFSKSNSVLNDFVYPKILGNSNFMSRIVRLRADGIYLTCATGSPENHVDFKPDGTTFDQVMAYDSMDHALQAAKILGIDIAQDTTLSRIDSIINKLDAIKIGASGQIKEFREESVYGQFGEQQHRHISHLLGLYPGTMVNSHTPAWLDAAATSLEKRGDRNPNGWALANRLCGWARLKDGDHAYTLLQNMLKYTTNENLLDVLDGYFQIDGNFGGTAGIAEMLLQSHEGYIEPLAALPSAWDSGEYSGLVARGAFEIGAKWNNGHATEFTIRSEAGEICTVKYPDIAKAIVTDADGKTVDFVRNGSDMISFETEKGIEYHITSIPFAKAVSPAKGLTAANSGNQTTLSWEASADAVSYCVYVALNDAPDYTLVTETELLSYTVGSEKSDTDRATYAVAAVDANGRVSRRTWVNINPVA